MPQQGNLQDLNILGERAAIDFTNTIDWRGREDSIEYLNSYEDLVDWARRIELINQSTATELKRRAAQNPDKAIESLQRAREFREAAYRVLYRLSLNEAPEHRDVELIDAEMQQMSMHLRLDLEEKQLTLIDEIDLDYVLRLIVKDTVDLLTSDQLNRVKRCQSDECGWLFIDTSKNNSRKWCNMNSCGNRAKARRHYKRSKKDD